MSQKTYSQKPYRMCQDVHDKKMKVVMKACRRGSIEEIDALASTGHMSSAKIRSEAMMEASEAGHLPLVKHLVDRYEVNFRTHLDGPLYGAISSGRTDVVHYLFDKLKGQQPLMSAIRCACSHGQLEILRYYTDLFPDHLKLVAYSALEDAAYANCLPILVFLIEDKNLLDILRLRASEFLSIACKTGSLPTFQYLVEQCQLNPMGHPSLMVDAMQNGDPMLIEYMVETLGFNLEILGTGLHFSVEQGNITLIKYLIRKGISKQAQRQAISVSARCGRIDILKLFSKELFRKQEILSCLLHTEYGKRWSCRVYLQCVFPREEELKWVEPPSYRSFIGFLTLFVKGRIEPCKMKGLCADYLFDGNLAMIVMSYV